jgi:hypothetical protein
MENLPEDLERVVTAAEALQAATQGLTTPVVNMKGSKLRAQPNALQSVTLAMRNGITPRQWATGIVAFNTDPDPVPVPPKDPVEEVPAS